MASGRAKAMQDTNGTVKILADADTDAVLGMHIVGAHSSELIGHGVLTLEFEGTIEDIARTVFAHPTLVVKEISAKMQNNSGVSSQYEYT